MKRQRQKLSLRPARAFPVHLSAAHVGLTWWLKETRTWVPHDAARPARVLQYCIRQSCVLIEVVKLCVPTAT